MNFIKMHGLGNDFVILDHRKPAPALDLETRILIADRHRGVGCDQLIIMEPSEKADIFMRIYNPDGSEAQACGNATRCVAHIIMTETKTQTCTIETQAGLLPCRLTGNFEVEVDMGAPKSIDENLDINDAILGHPIGVNMGNPHCVFFVDNAEDINVEEMGKTYETHGLFPEKTNVEFISRIDESTIRVRVWERGAGITLACGSGACASIVAAITKNMVSHNKITVMMDGGPLHLEWHENDKHVLMTGPVTYVFKGEMRS